MTIDDIQPEIQTFAKSQIAAIIPALDYLHEIFATCDFLSDEECIACAASAD